MVRPKYETNEDLLNEREVSKLLLKHGHKCYKLPVSYRVDWIVFSNDRLMGFIELKTRRNSVGKYPSLILSLAKYSEGCQLARMTGTDFWVAAKWNDYLGFCCCTSIPIEIQMGGRYDRNDRDDFEPVVHLPTELFEDKPISHASF